MYTENEIFQTIHSLTKIYPTFSRTTVFKKPFSSRISGFEAQKKIEKSASDGEISETDLERSIRRTKTTISDLTLSNNFDMFATFTFKSDRDDIEKSKTKMSNWLQSQQKIHGKFFYLIVPEFHKDKKAIHFHALLSGYKGKLTLAINRKTNKPIRDKGQTVYNIESYNSGFSTVKTFGNKDTPKVANYIKKYITKDMLTFGSKKRYWCSTGLARPVTIFNSDIRTNPFLAYDLKYETEDIAIYQTSDTIRTLNNYKGISWQNHKTHQAILKLLISSKLNWSQVSLFQSQAISTLGTESESSLQKVIQL